MEIAEIAINHTTDALLVVNYPSLEIMFTNRAFSKYYGYSSRELIKKAYNNLFINNLESTPESLSKGISFNLKLELEHKNGSPVASNAQFSPIFDIEGKVEQWIICLKPSGQEDGLKGSLIRISEHLNAVVDNAPLVLWSIDRNGEFKQLTGNKLNLFNASGGDLIGKSIFAVFHEDTEFTDAVQKALHHDLTQATTLIGQHYFETHFSDLKDNAGSNIGLIGVSIEVTERVENERRLIDAKKKAEAATHAKTEFLANMSHEIRTPLNGIMGFSEILLRAVDDPKLQKYTQAITSSGKNLLRLINDILDLSKIESGNVELEVTQVNPGDLLNEINTLFDLESQRKGIAFEIDDAHTSKLLMLDATRLRQILFNLVGNAFKYTRAGTVWINCYERDRCDTETTLIFEVKDTGAGISEINQKQIFQPFVQKHSNAGGAGLGLSITKRLLAIMKGQIELESLEGEGSLFRIILPNVVIAKTASATRKEEQINSSEYDFKEATILVTDDIEINIELVRAFLENTNITVLEANSGSGALVLAQKYQPDVILMDLKMPDMDGFETTKALKASEETKHIPIIALTAQAFEEEEARIRKLGATGFIRKPLDRVSLVGALKAVLAHEAKAVKKQNKNTGKEEIDTEIYAKLETELHDQWSKVHKSSVLGELKTFSAHLEAVALEANNRQLNEFTTQLTGHIEKYDIEGVSNTLKTYPKLLETLKTSLRQLS